MMQELLIRRDELAAELASLEERIGQMQSTEALNEAIDLVKRAKASLKKAVAVDERQRRDAEAKRKADLQSRRAEVEAAIQAAEAEYRSACVGGLRQALEANPNYAPKAEEARLLEHPDTAPVSIASPSWMLFNDKDGYRVGAARRKLADLRRQLDAVLAEG